MGYYNDDRKLMIEIYKTQRRIMIMLEELKAEVERNRTVDESAKALIVGIYAKLIELSTRPTVDPAEVKSLADELKGSSDSLAEAVAANTPAE